MSATQSSVRLRVADPGMVLVAQQHARRVAKLAGLDAAGADHAALAAAELAGNAQRHGRAGELLLQPSAEGAAIDVVAFDRGPGVADWARSSADGYSTTPGSLGTGLGAVARIATTLTAHSELNRGTVVSARIGPAGNAPMVSAFGSPRRGERINGDAWSWSVSDGEVFAVLADGLGHGPDAAAASALAVADVASLAASEPPQVLHDVHARLRSTRGAAVTVVRLRRSSTGEGSELLVTGVGNVAATVVALDGSVRRTLISAGTAGLAVRTPTQTITPVPTGSVVVLHTDGLLSSWTMQGRARVVAAPPAVLAAVLLRDFERGTDDTGVVVLRPPAALDRLDR
ncbi:SpoIIE family protein phosphatase [Modestobacter marinus]|nr:SpoIIE family protein phosphatase [Modestobacter marinus]